MRNRVIGLAAAAAILTAGIGGLRGPSTEPVQGFLAGMSAVGACDDRGTGLRAGGVAGWTGSLSQRRRRTANPTWQLHRCKT
jgi:hypothetical protein